MKKNTLRILALVLAAAFVLLFSGCATSSTIAQNAPDGETLEVTGECTIERIDESTVKVHCTTNLMNGTVIGISLDTYQGVLVEQQTYSKQSENFYGVFTVSEKIEGPIYAHLVAAPKALGNQDKAVTSVYGKKFQNLTGEHIIWNNEGNLVVIQSEPIDSLG